MCDTIVFDYMNIMNISRLKKIFLSVLVLVVMSVPLSASAQVPFGGYTIAIPILCTCSLPNIEFFVFDFVTKSMVPLVYIPGVSRLNSYYNFATPGNSVLGTYTPGAVCLITVTGADCEPFPILPIGTVTSFPFSGMGTSASPGRN